jgi:hypothetical protein
MQRPNHIPIVVEPEGDEIGIIAAMVRTYFTTNPLNVL